MALRHYTEEEHAIMSERVADMFGIPEEKRFITKLHEFEGVTFNLMVPPENIVAVRDWETREDDIFISTYPKSGTHWILEIVLLVLAKGHPEAVDRSKMPTSTIETQNVPEQERPNYEVLDAMESPRIIVTHLPWQFLPKQLTEQKKGRVIYLMRNPKDVVTSIGRFFLASSGKEKDETLWEYLRNNILTGNFPFGSWFDHVEKCWQHRNQRNVFFTSYEQMQKDLRSVVKTLVEFLGQELDEDALDRVAKKSTVKEMKKSYDDVEKNVPGGAFMVKAFGMNHFLQKGVIGSWKDYFTVAENELFDQVCKERMANWDMDVVYQ